MTGGGLRPSLSETLGAALRNGADAARLGAIAAAADRALRTEKQREEREAAEQRRAVREAEQRTREAAAREAELARNFSAARDRYLAAMVEAARAWRALESAYLEAGRTLAARLLAVDPWGLRQALRRGVAVKRRDPELLARTCGLHKVPRR